MLFVIAKREEGERGEHKVHPHKSFRSAKDEQEYIVSAFPDIGMKNARLLLAHFGSIQGIANASLEELVAVKGIGEKTGGKILSCPEKVRVTVEIFFGKSLFTSIGIFHLYSEHLKKAMPCRRPEGRPAAASIVV